MATTPSSSTPQGVYGGGPGGIYGGPQYSGDSNGGNSLSGGNYPGIASLFGQYFGAPTPGGAQANAQQAGPANNAIQPTDTAKAPNAPNPSSSPYAPGTGGPGIGGPTPSGGSQTPKPQTTPTADTSSPYSPGTAGPGIGGAAPKAQPSGGGSQTQPSTGGTSGSSSTQSQGYTPPNYSPGQGGPGVFPGATQTPAASAPAPTEANPPAYAPTGAGPGIFPGATTSSTQKQADLLAQQPVQPLPNYPIQDMANLANQTTSGSQQQDMANLATAAPTQQLANLANQSAPGTQQLATLAGNVTSNQQAGLLPATPTAKSAPVTKTLDTAPVQMDRGTPEAPGPAWFSQWGIDPDAFAAAQAYGAAHPTPANWYELETGQPPAPKSAAVNKPVVSGPAPQVPSDETPPVQSSPIGPTSSPAPAQQEFSEANPPSFAATEATQPTVSPDLLNELRKQQTASA